MKTVKAYISGKNTATIICDQCGRSKEVDVSGISDVYVPRRVNCPCGSSFEVLFEKRRQFRKGVSLRGICWKTNSSKHQAISIKTLTGTSIGFQIQSESVTHPDEEPDIQTGDSLLVEFTLDDDEQTVIRGKIVVRSVSKKSIGGEFLNLDGHAKKQLGFYVMP